MMSGGVRAAVSGETMPLFVPIGLAIIGSLFALLTVREVLYRTPPAQAAATMRTTTSTATDVDGLPQRTMPTTQPGMAASTPADAAAPADCPSFPRFSFRIGDSIPVDTLDTEVADLVAWMKAHPDAVLIVEGHADSIGGPKRNLSLSFDRARAVAGLFTSHGLHPKRIDVEAYGAFRPIDRRDGPSAIDRRVSLRTGGDPVCPNREGNVP